MITNNKRPFKKGDKVKLISTGIPIGWEREDFTCQSELKLNEIYTVHSSNEYSKGYPVVYIEEDSDYPARFAFHPDHFKLITDADNS